LSIAHLAQKFKNNQSVYAIEVESNCFKTGKATFLLDSGAILSVINLSTLNTELELNPLHDTRLVGVTGNLLSLAGSISVDFKANNYIFSQNFIVSFDDLKLNTSGILGLDFINFYNLHLLLPEKVIANFKDNRKIEIPVIKVDSNIRSINVINSDLNINSGSESEINSDLEYQVRLKIIHEAEKQAGINNNADMKIRKNEPCEADRNRCLNIAELQDCTQNSMSTESKSADIKLSQVDSEFYKNMENFETSLSNVASNISEERICDFSQDDQNKSGTVTDSLILNLKRISSETNTNLNKFLKEGKNISQVDIAMHDFDFVCEGKENPIVYEGTETLIVYEGTETPIVYEGTETPIVYEGTETPIVYEGKETPIFSIFTENDDRNRNKDEKASTTIVDNPPNPPIENINCKFCKNNVDIEEKRILRSVIKLTKDFKIAARCQMVCLGQQQSLFELGSYITIYPKDVLCNGIYVGHSLYQQTDSNRIPVIICNILYEEITLQKGTTLAYVETICQNENQNLFIDNYCSINTINSVDRDQNFIKRFKLDHLDISNKELLETMLYEYEDIFVSAINPKLGLCTYYRHRIDTTTETPVAKAPYRVPYYQRELMAEKVNELLQQGAIVKSDSPWCFPCILVKKRSLDGTPSTRLVYDARSLNSITIPDKYPLPNIKDSLSLLHDTGVYTLLDLQSAFNQMEIVPEHRCKAAFSVLGEKYESNRLLFGLINAPSSFQRLANMVFSGLKDKIMLIYLDDAIIFSKTISENFERLRCVFDAIRKSGLKLRCEKGDFIKQEISYLGFTLNRFGIFPDERNTIRLKTWERPTTVKQIRQLVGFINYYRSHLRNFSEHVAPLVELTKKKVQFRWSKPQQDAFEFFIKALTSEPILKFPNFNLQFILETDGSRISIGSILSQRNLNDDKIYPVGYYSSMNNKSQRKYSATDLEVLSIVKSIKYFRIYLYATPIPFIIFTDHKPLLSWMRMKDTTSCRAARYSLLMSDYNFEIKYRKGTQHQNADFISRQNINPIASISNLVHEQNIPYEPVLERSHIKSEQRADPKLVPIIETLLKNPNSDDQFSLDEEGILYKVRIGLERQDKLVVPEHFIPKIIKSYHEPVFCSHPGFERTYGIIKSRFYWFTMYKDVKAFCQSCVKCALYKAPRNLMRAPLGTFPETTYVFQRVHFDFLGPINPKSSLGNRYILVFQDFLSKYLICVPTKNMTSDTVAQVFVTHLILKHGSVSQLISDRAPNFLSAFMQEIYKLLGVKKLQTVAWNPQANGLAERNMSTIKTMLRINIGKFPKQWDTYVNFICFAYNSAPHATTKETPYFLLTGRDVIFPWDTLIEPIKTNTEFNNQETYNIAVRLQEAITRVKLLIAKSEIKQKVRFNLKSKPAKFKVTDKVYLRVPPSLVGISPGLQVKYKGPYRITHKTGDKTFQITEIYGAQQSQYVTSNRLKICHDMPAFITHQCSIDQDSIIPDELVDHGNDTSTDVSAPDERVFLRPNITPQNGDDNSTNIPSNDELSDQDDESLHSESTNPPDSQSEHNSDSESEHGYHLRSRGPVVDNIPWTLDRAI
jgi:RNase H-like domain found in reverse transcriptase/Reverse transcriptase (RNA-dependent DNA polymerase)/Integrase zinc binding domain